MSSICVRVCVCVKLRVSNAGNVSLHKRGDPTAYLPFSLSHSLWLLLSAFLYSAAINVIGTGFCLANKRRFDPCPLFLATAAGRGHRSLRADSSQICSSS